MVSDEAFTAAAPGGSAPQEVRENGVHELFEAIIKYVPVPDLDANAPLQALITTLDYSDYVGRIGIGRVFAGTLKAGQTVAVIGRDGAVSSVSDGGSDIGNPAVVSCVVRAFYGLSFPQPEGGIVTVTYPILFSPLH